jgi:glycosyltransferase involved in cell wall biosynthesis
MSKIPSGIWIVIPAHNEQKYIGTVLEKVSKYTKQIIVVDDGSQDSTSDQSQKFTKHVLKHQVNLGKGAALKTGCEYAFKVQHAEAVIVMDSDDQHDPAELPLFVAALQNSPVVFGVRSFNGMPKVRVYGNIVLSKLVQLLFGMYIPDILSGYKAFTADAYKTIYWESSAYGVELEIAVRIAKSKAKHATIAIKTIYHDLERGMTVLDATAIISQVISWRISV